MSRTTITHAAAKAEARAIQADSKKTATPLNYTQSLAEVAKRHGFANVHEMTAAYDSPKASNIELPAGWQIAAVHPLLVEIDRNKGRIVILQRRPDDGTLALLEAHFSTGGYAYLPAFDLKQDGPLILPDLHMATPGSSLDAVIIDGLDRSVRKNELLEGLAQRKLYDKPLPEGVTIIVTMFDSLDLGWKLIQEPANAAILNPKSLSARKLKPKFGLPVFGRSNPTAADLADYFAKLGESLQFPKDLWRQAVRREETLDGYWDWAAERHAQSSIQPRREDSGPFKVTSYEKDRYTDGKRVYDDRRGFYDGKIRDFESGSHAPGEPEAYAAQLNAIHAAGGKGAMVLDYAIANGLAVDALEPSRLSVQGLKGLPFKGVAEMLAEFDDEDGTSGQDRESYLDDQDRDSYTAD